MPADLRDVLTDIVKQTVGLFEVVKVTGTPDETKLQASDTDKTLFLLGTLSEPEPSFEGDFGLSSLGMLNGFLSHATFRTDGAEIVTERLPRGKNGAVTLANINFRDASGDNGAIYRAMSAELAGEQPTVRQMPWDITIAPQKAKVAEFSQLASLLSDVDKNFTVQTRKSKTGIDLVFGIGSSGSSSHSATMVFEASVDALNEVKQPLVFNTKQFLDVMKAAGNNTTTLTVFHKGVLGLTIETGRGTYHYFLRAKA